MYGILYLALNSRRQVSMFLIICTPILAKLLAEILEKYAPKLQNKIISFTISFYPKVILATIFIIITLKNIRPKINEPYYTNQDYPIKAAAWIKENLDVNTIRLFNEYNYGSYLIFEGIPVMIDSRCDLYTPQYNTKTGDPADGQDIFMDVQNVATGADDYRETFERYGITHVITYQDSNLNKKIKNNSDYEKIYPLADEEKEADSRFVIYQKYS